MSRSPKPKKPRVERSLEKDAIFKEFYSDVKLLEFLEFLVIKSNKARRKGERLAFAKLLHFLYNELEGQYKQKYM